MEKLAYIRNGNEYAIAVVDAESFKDGVAAVALGLNIPEVSVTYLLQYGFNQSEQDAAAQPASAAKKEKDSTPESVLAAIHGSLMKRLAAIKAGTVAIKGGVGRVQSQFDALTREIIDAQMAAWALEKGKALPKKNAELEPWRVKWYGQRRADVDAELSKRAESPVEALEAEIDFSE